MEGKKSCVMFYRGNAELKERVKQLADELKASGAKITPSSLQRKIIEKYLDDHKTKAVS